MVLGSSSATIAWSPPPAEHQNGLIRRYHLILYSVLGNETRRHYPSSILEVNVTNLRPYTEYQCRVHAETVSTGPATVVNFTTQEDGKREILLLSVIILCVMPLCYYFPSAPTGPPSGVAIQSTSATSMLISWRPPIDHPNGIIRKYVINVTEEKTGVQEQFITDQNNITIHSRHPFYYYRCVVSAETIAPGPWSRPVVIRQPEAS